ncbi:MAG TPA: PorV/PorQ family protein [Rhodothermales bacterium]|nr:PorV/PorQ family protein [Rhodothermales bacterium]
MTRIPVLSMCLLLSVSVVTSEAQLIPSFGRDRAGTSGFQFLKIPVDARSAAMGQAVATNAVDASALFWNPALIAQSRARTILGVSHTSYHADVKLNYLAAAQDIGGVTLGFSLQSMDSGEMPVTTEFQPFGTGETFKVIDLSLGLTVAQQLTDLFSYGVTARYVEEGIASVTHKTLVLDAGIFYRIGETGTKMAVSIRSFGFDSSSDGEIERTVVSETGVRIEDNFESMTPATTFLMGIAYDVFHRSGGDKSLLLSVQLNNPNDNAESYNIGVEYLWNRLLALRTGYRFGVEEAEVPSFGFGLLLPGIGPDVRFDYGFNQLERLGSVHRIGLDVGL